ncbi:hypothetical protein ACHAWU_008495 [Discostella pseudostelligera]|uniref:Peptidyl-prolyl cis-trans isomerase n=1 Tax=Discostella pseudostelligera TaxID=259834 RepID=A0ABD3M3M0_9STRA
MSLLLETTFGDLVLDLDVDGSPALCKNILKLAKARYYTNTLIYNIVPGKYCQMGDPSGDGTGGCSIYGLIDAYQSSLVANGNNKQKPKPIPPDVTKSQRRFLQSHGRNLSPDELNQKGLIIAMELANVPHTIGSQFLLTLSDTNGLRDLISTANKVDDGGNDGMDKQNNTAIRYLSLGTVVEDSQNILSKLNRAYCDDNGRPYADIRIQRALVIHDPFDDPAGMEDLLRWRGVEYNSGEVGEGDIRGDVDLNEGCPLAPQSPSYDRPIEEIVPTRIQADDTTLFATAGWDDDNASNEYEDEEDEDEAARQHRLELQEKQEEEWRKRQETSKAVLLEMLGDRPTADIQAPENVLFVCKLNPFTNDEDLELIFSRFDSRAKAEIIRDPDTGASLQYAFVEFTTNEACNEAYLKMNNALVDDRRIRVDFSQSVAKVWDRYHRKYRMGDRSGVDRGFVDGAQNNSGRGRGYGREHGRGRGPSYWNSTRSNVPGRNSRDQFGYGNKGQQQPQQQQLADDNRTVNDSEFGSFGRVVRSRDANEKYHSQQSENGNGSRSGSHRPRDDNQSHNLSRDRAHDARRDTGSGSRNNDRRSRSPCSDSSDSGRRRKKHHKHRRKDSSRRKRSRSRERERKAKKRRHRHRDYSSSEDDETHDNKHRQSHHRSR